MGKGEALDTRCHYIDAKTEERCRGFHQKGSLFCFMHDPNKEQERAIALSEGGKSRAFISNLAPFKVENIKDIPKTIARVINEVRKGCMASSEANSIIYGMGVMLKAYEIIGEEQKRSGQDNFKPMMSQEELDKEIDLIIKKRQERANNPPSQN